MRDQQLTDIGVLQTGQPDDGIFTTEPQTAEGVVNVLKPPGMTSHDVVSRLRRIYRVKKAGHSGTLDPDAAGVLPVFIGGATRLLEYASVKTKCYRAEGLLGLRTDTGDDSGRILEEKPIPRLTEAVWESCLEGFRGRIRQTPPMYSALKIKGKKLYEYAREGIELPRESRPIEIFRLELTDRNEPYFTLDVECSQGTYIRTLIEDIGIRLGTCACMSFLLRTRAGAYHIEDSHTLEEIQARPQEMLLPAESAVAALAQLTVNALQAWRITGGVRTTVKGTENGIYRLYDGLQFLGIAEVREEIVRPLKVLHQAPRPPEPTP